MSSRNVEHRSVEQWRAALAYRFDEAASEPADSNLALAHLQECGRCRAIALGIDPSLVFAAAPEPAMRPNETKEINEIDAMRAAVAGLRHASALQARSESPAVDVPVSGGRRAWIGRVAAGLALATLLGTQLGDRALRTTLVAVTPAPSVRTAALIPAVPARMSSERVASGGGGLAVAGDVGRPRARVYEIGYSDLAVVMVVDKSLDL